MEVLQRTANRGSISTGYDIDYSLKCAGLTSNEWFYRSSPTASSTQTTFTFSFWIKRSVIYGYPADPYLISQGTNARFHFTGNTTPTLRFMWDGSTTELEATAPLRDTSAWYHIVLAVDTTQATAANRVKAYVNGVQYAWSNSKYPTQSSTSTWMSTTNMYFNTRDGDGSYDAGQYWAEVCVIDGQQLDPTSFGEFDSDTGIWKPIDVSGLTFGSEGFYLDFSNSASLGADSSGNGNNCTLNNITSADQATDTPTNNFATYNALINTNPTYGTSGGYEIRNGMTSFDQSDASIFSTNLSSIGVKNGKWYAEFSGAFSNNSFVGINVMENVLYTANSYPGLRADSEHPGIGYYSDNGRIYKNATNIAFGNSYTDNDIMGVALDMDNQYIYFAKNGTWQNSGDPTSGSSGTGGIALTTDAKGTLQFYGFAVAIYSNDGAVTCNFGGFPGFTISSGNADENGYGNFEYAPPSGYYALCSKNLAEYG